MAKTYSITLPDEVARILEVRAMGVDGIPVEEGIARLLTYLAQQFAGQRKRGAA